MYKRQVLSRGYNHQTIQAGSKGSSEIIEIMEGFMHRFEPVTPESSPDDGFDTVIDMDVLASSRENLETVVTRLYEEYPKLFSDQDMPTSDDMDAAIQAALNDYTVDIKHEIKGRSDDRRPKPGNQQPHNGVKTQPNGQSKPKERKLEYFAVQLAPTRVNTILEAMFRDASPEIAQMYNTMKAQRRVQTEFHVTLIHRASSAEHPEQWAKLSDMHDKAASPSQPEPKLGMCKVRLERLVWDDRIMAFVVRLAPFDAGSEHFGSVNPTAHVTVGTAAPSVKPKESNDLLARWLQEGSNGENGISELAVKGSVELDGTVRGVLQKH